MLQSPRVKAGFSIGLHGYYDVHTTHREWDSVFLKTGPAGVVSSDTIRRLPDSKEDLAIINPLVLKWGILERVEIGGLMGLFYNQGIIKCFVHEFGRPVGFKNIALAVFAGGLFILDPGDYDVQGGYVGIIAASRHSTRTTEFEFIFQPSYYEHHQYFHTGAAEDGRIRGLSLSSATKYNRNRCC